MFRLSPTPLAEFYLDSAPGHQLAPPRPRRAVEAGGQPRMRLVPSPFSNKQLVVLVVTSRGALHPKAEDAQDVHRQGRFYPLGQNPSHSA